jgi:hypothetical protein
MRTRPPWGVSAEKNLSELDPAAEEAMQSALHVQSTSLAMSRSTTAGHLLHSALELRRVQTTARHISSSSSERTFRRKSRYLWTVSMSVADRSPLQWLQGYQPKCWCWSWYRLSQKAWLSHAHRWLLWKLNTSWSAEHASCVPTTLCKESLSAACSCRSHSQNFTRRGLSTKDRCSLRELCYGCNWSSWNT